MLKECKIKKFTSLRYCLSDLQYENKTIKYDDKMVKKTTTRKNGPSHIKKLQ